MSLRHNSHPGPSSLGGKISTMSSPSGSIPCSSPGTAGPLGARGFHLPPCGVSGDLPFGPKIARFLGTGLFLGQMGASQKSRMAGAKNLEHPGPRFHASSHGRFSSFRCASPAFPWSHFLVSVPPIPPYVARTLPEHRPQLRAGRSPKPLPPGPPQKCPFGPQKGPPICSARHAIPGQDACGPPRCKASQGQAAALWALGTQSIA